MIGDIININPLILDVVVVAVFVLIIFFGVIRGIKNVSIDMTLVLIALFLGFSPSCNFLKDVFLSNILHLEKLAPAGSSPSYKFGITLFSNLVVSICLFLLFYVLFQLVKLLINIILKSKNISDSKRKSKVGRIFAGLIALIYQGFIFVTCLLFANNNLIGMNEVYKKSTVTNFIVEGADKLFQNIDKEFSAKLTIKLLKGDILYEVSEANVENYRYIDEKAEKMFDDTDYINILSDPKVSKEEIIKFIKERINDLDVLSITIQTYDDFDASKEEFVTMAEEWIVVMNRTFLERDLEKIEMTLNDVTNLKVNLENAGIEKEILELYDEIIVGK